MKMDATLLDVGLAAHVIETVLAERLGRDTDDVLFLRALRLELWFDGMFPLAFNDLLDTGLAEVIPATAKSRFACPFKSLVNEDTTA
jgi:hypothetical protein